MDANLRQELLTLYDAVDRQVAQAGPICVASGRCCRFREYGHSLFLSHLEAEVLLDGAPEYKQPASSDFCPFQKDNLCTARECRPLGCRIYFCDPAYQETAHRITEDAIAKLKELAQRTESGWLYAPLHFFLNHPERARPCPATGTA